MQTRERGGFMFCVLFAEINLRLTYEFLFAALTSTVATIGVVVYLSRTTRSVGKWFQKILLKPATSSIEQIDAKIDKMNNNLLLVQFYGLTLPRQIRLAAAQQIIDCKINGEAAIAAQTYIDQESAKMDLSGITNRKGV